MQRSTSAPVRAIRAVAAAAVQPAKSPTKLFTCGRRFERRPLCFEDLILKPAQEQLVADVIAQLECGTAPWVRPWSVSGTSDMPHNLATNRAYNGVNVIQLWMTQTTLAYPTAEWCTFQQAKLLGGSVRKGERGTSVWFIAPRVSARANTDTDDESRTVGGVTFKQYTVFNRAQCDGLPPIAVTEYRSAPERLAIAEAYVTAIGADVRYGGDTAFFTPTADFIGCPTIERFVDAASYYGTLLHEHIHWTGHKERLARTFGKRFGDNAYAAEELVAELGAAFLTAALGIAGSLRHVEYLGHWAHVLRADPQALWTAGAAATKAVAFLDRAAGVVPTIELADAA
jgi:antirestriction protein ArdC